MTCETCGQEISPARVAAVPGVTNCLECARLDDVPRTVGYMCWAHKTAPELIMGRDAELLRPYDRRGFHASLPLSSYGNPRLVIPQTQNLSLAVREARPPEDVALEAVVMNPARCHPGQPRINPAGDCLPCALAKQALRVR